MKIHRINLDGLKSALPSLDKARNGAAQLKSDLHAMSGRVSNFATTAPRQALNSLKNNILKHENDPHSQGAMLDGAPDLFGKGKALPDKAKNAIKKEIFKHENDPRSQGATLDAAADLFGKGAKLVAKAKSASSKAGNAIKSEYLKRRSDVASTPSTPPRLPPRPQWQSAMMALQLPTTLSPEYVADKMKTIPGRKQLGEEVIKLMSEVPDRAEQLQALRPASASRIGEASELVMGRLAGIRDELTVIARSSLKEDARKDCLAKMDMDSPMSLQYVQANATSAEGIARMRGELADFEQALNKAYKAGHLALHPDKVIQRQGGAGLDGAAFERRHQKASNAYDAFNAAHQSLKVMAQGLGLRLDQMERG